MTHKFFIQYSFFLPIICALVFGEFRQNMPYVRKQYAQRQAYFDSRQHTCEVSFHFVL